MAGLKGVFLDTSVLLAGMVDLGPSSRAPFEIFDAVADGRIREAQTAWHCCLEFYSVSTRLPEEYRLDPATARQLVKEEIFGRLAVRGLPSAARERFFSRAVAEGIAGGAIYDAHIAEVARIAGAKIVVTENRRHFSGLLRDDIRVVDSATLASEL